MKRRHCVQRRWWHLQ